MPRELPQPADFPYLIREHSERLDSIQDQLRRHDPAVTAEQIKNLRDELRSLKAAIYTVGGGIIIAALTLAFTLIARGGH